VDTNSQSLARKHGLLLPLLLLAALLAGCATPLQPAPPRSPGTAHPAPESSTPAEAPDAESDIAAPSPTLALRHDSARAAAGGDVYRAIALLERAIRIDPNDASLWLELAGLHLEQGAYDEAEQFARKALTLMRRQPVLEQEAWLIIDHARSGRPAPAR
jgi:tetratricopeptide (TPR) repeat protein